MSSSLFSITLTLAIYAATFAASQDIIGYPQEEKNSKNPRNPIESTLCPPGEWLYPGDQKSDWICDCQPAYLYSPKTDRCHEVYKQGPCKKGEYIILGSDGFIPTCVENRCKKDGFVYHKKSNSCQKFNTADVCDPSSKKQLVLGVNPVTLAIECVEAELGSRFGDDDDDITKVSTTGECPPWSRRDVKGLCKKDILLETGT